MGEGLMSPMKQAQAWDRLRRSAIGLNPNALMVVTSDPDEPFS